MALFLGLSALGVWFTLIFGRGLFWAVEVPDLSAAAGGDAEVVAVVPARDEAATIAQTVSGLLSQSYGGALTVVVVDDQSSDGTGKIARLTAETMGAGSRLTVLDGERLPEGWSGKLWALDQGIRRAREINPAFIWLTDADIVHAPGNLARLVTRATLERRDLVSQMVKLRCESWAERALIPAFVYFFFMIYPPRWAADPARKLAAAAGGSILIRPQALDSIGGIERIRGALIDDCSLAAAVKSEGGRIRLDVTEDAHSIRVYGGFEDVWSMIARTAFTQLDHSALLLAGTLAGLALTFLVPPWLALFGHGSAVLAGWVAWGLMAASFAPTLKLYRRSPLWGAALPLIALFYSAATIGSAVKYWQGTGGQWKGRAQARSAGATSLSP